MSLLNASYALRASALASGLPLNRKSGFRNAAPPYFHLRILQRQSVAICSFTVLSHTPVCFAKSALFVLIRPSSPVMLTRVKRSFNAAFSSLKFLIAVTSTARPPFSFGRACAPSRSFFYCFEGCGGFPPRPRFFIEKNFISAGINPAYIKFYNTVLPFYRARFQGFSFCFFCFGRGRKSFSFSFSRSENRKKKKQKTIEQKTKTKKATKQKTYLNLVIFYAV